MEKDFENTIIKIKNLNIGFKSPKKELVIKGLNLNLSKSKITALVGKSGSGKSLTALSILGITNLIENSFVNGEIEFNDNGKKIDLLKLNDNEIIKYRGSKIAMIFQDPFSSFNPIKKCGDQIVEIKRQRKQIDKKKAEEESLTLLSKMGIDKRVFSSYPHQLSGGQLQRVGIAIALASNPDLLIADEPTTNLDASLKKELLDLLVKIKEETGISILYISHDLNAVKYIADEVALIHEGKVIPTQSKKEFFDNPNNEYIHSLNSSFLNFVTKSKSFNEGNGIELMTIKRLNKYFSKNSWLSFLFKNKSIHALKNVSLDLKHGEVIGVIGESGSGKSTLARVIMKLIDFANGKISYEGKNIINLNKPELKKYRKEVQIVFQNPLSSLNPVLKIKSLLAEPFEIYNLYENKSDKENKILKLVQSVGLSPKILDKYPDQISGGEGQRIAIARAMAIQPKILILDESVSSLDKFAQKEILELLLKLREKQNLTYIFITHDLKLSRYFCDRLMILKDGEIIEFGNTENIFNNPSNPYTKKLLDAVL